MELGNMMFGNSRGEFEIERGCGWENELVRLFEAYAPNRDNGGREYGEQFENEVFTVSPYYWGDCTCGYDEKEWAWDKSHNHSNECYQVEYCKIRSPYEIGIDHDVWVRKYIKPLYQKFGLDTKLKNWWHGCTTVCTCSYKDEWVKFVLENDHNPDCLTVRPNFLYKPTGFAIKWYKYPLRDSYKNQDVSLREFHTIIDDCTASTHNQSLYTAAKAARSAGHYQAQQKGEINENT